MWIAHANDGSRAERGGDAGGQFQLHGIRIYYRLLQRNLAPGQARRTHIDAKDEFALAAAFEQAGFGLHLENLRSALHQPIGDAARAIAAGARFAAVIVEDRDIGVGAWTARIGDDHQLIKSETPPLMDRTRVRTGRRNAGAAQVEHDDLVAGAVHLGDGAADQSGREIRKFSTPPLDGLAPRLTLTLTLSRKAGEGTHRGSQREPV